MLDEENDKKIKEAAEHYHPAYDDTAWEKMSQLLDEHLPQKKERRWIFFILPSLLLVAALLFFIVMNNGKKDISDIAKNESSKNIMQESLVQKPSLNSKEKSSPTAVESANPLFSKENKTKNDNGKNSITDQKLNKDAIGQIDQNKNESPFFKNNIVLQKNELNEQPVIKANNENENNDAVSSGELKSGVDNKKDSLIPAQNQHNSEIKTLAGKTNDVEIQNEKPTQAIKKSKKPDSDFANNFAISITAGPDISGVRANKIGKLTAVFGAGMQYSFSKHFGIRSGFYVSKKIYSVQGNDYNMPGGNPNYAYLQNVDANCTVYEIPLKLDYNFKEIKKHNWFISTGLSSYLMKKENYDYYYKTLSGEIYDKDWTVKNKNKHFFSVLSFSGGYQYYFNKQFSFVAEPYVNLPLKGVGEGKVKLNSGGILLTLKMKPFVKNEKLSFQ